VRERIFQSFVCLLLACLLASPVFACQKTTCKKPKKSFEVYMETGFENQPDFAKYGAKDLGTLYAGNMFNGGKGRDKSLLPSKSKTTSFVEKKYASHTGLLVLDIESWPVKGSDAIVASSVDKYLTVLEWVKSAAPKAKVGYYGRPPVPTYSAVQKGTEHQSYKEWQAQNDRLALLADAVDAFFPDCYPNNANQEGWVRKCVALINEAKRLGPGKKVYPFINPRYHSQAAKGLAWSLVPEDYFLLQLKTLKQHADGVVIWDLSRRPWNEKEPWWQATLEFLGSK